MGKTNDPHQTVVVFPFQKLRQVPRQGSLHHGIRGELGLLGSTAFQFVDDKGELKRQRILGPERPVVVEDRDSLGCRNEVRSAFLGYLRDEVQY